jgi:hypothetical protein
MCYYITLVVRGSDSATIDHLLRDHGRQAKLMNNTSISGALVPGETQYLTTVRHCDCGTVLAPSVADRTSKRAEQAAKLAKKGWSQAKIERWLGDKVKADHQAKERHQARAPDSIELWSRIIADLVGTPGVQQAGLLLHFYSGYVEQEEFKPTRETVGIRDLDSRLRNMREDHIMMVAA